MRVSEDHGRLDIRFKSDPEGYWIAEYWHNGIKIGSINTNTKDKETAKETIKGSMVEILEHLKENKDVQIKGLLYAIK